MKKITLLILLLSIFSGLSQVLSKKEIRNLQELNIKTESLDLHNLNIQKDLNTIIVLDRKRKTNKTIGIVLTSLSATSMILGGTLLSKDQEITKVFGGAFVTGGIIYGGISIPFWISSKKRKRERNKLIKKFEKAF